MLAPPNYRRGLFSGIKLAKEVARSQLPDLEKARQSVSNKQIEHKDNNMSVEISPGTVAINRVISTCRTLMDLIPNSFGEKGERYKNYRGGAIHVAKIIYEFRKIQSHIKKTEFADAIGMSLDHLCSFNELVYQRTPLKIWVDLKNEFSGLCEKFGEPKILTELINVKTIEQKEKERVEEMQSKISDSATNLNEQSISDPNPFWTTSPSGSILVTVVKELHPGTKEFEDFVRNIKIPDNFKI